MGFSWPHRTDMSWQRHFFFTQLILTWANERLTNLRQQIGCCWSREGTSGSLLNKLHIWLSLTEGEFVITNFLPVIRSLSDMWSPRKTVCHDLMLFAAYLARHQWVCLSPAPRSHRTDAHVSQTKKSSLLKNKVRVYIRSKALRRHFVSSAACGVSAGTLFLEGCPHCAALAV